MTDDEIKEKLNQIKMENYIWVIYVAIIFTSWYANKYEEDYFLNGNVISKDKYQKLLIFIFTILTIIYFYFFKNSYEDVKNIKLFDTCKKKKLTYLSFTGSLLILVSGIVFLFVVLNDSDIDVEVAFN